MAKQTWHIAASLETLREQLNTAFPERSKVSDGAIGNSEHSARASDHNPNENHTVCARDFTHDPQTGIDCQWLADTLVKNKDPRIKYIIWNHQICSSTTSPWKWRPYSGKNGHTHHLHLSVNAAPKLAESTQKWDLDFPDNTKINDVAKGISTLSAGASQSAIQKPLASTPDQGGLSGAPADSQVGDVPAGAASSETKVEVTEGGGVKVDTSSSAATEDKPFIQYIPDAAKDKSLWVKIIGALGLGNVGVWFSGLPDYAKLLMGALLGIALWQFGKFIIQNREKVWSFVSDAMHLKSDPAKNSPVLTTDKDILNGETIPTAFLRRDMRAELVAELGNNPEEKYEN